MSKIMKRGLGVAFLVTLVLAFGLVSAGEATFYSTNDTWIYSVQPNDNHGTSNHLRVGYDSDPSKNETYMSFVKFDDFVLPGDVVVNSAKLRLYIHSNRAVDNTRRHSVARVLSDWDERIMDWINKPSWNGSFSDYQVISAGDEYIWIEWDVTNDVQSFSNGHKNYGWAILDEVRDDLMAISGNDYELWYSSKENRTFIPELIVDYKTSLESSYFQGNGTNRSLFTVDIVGPRGAQQQGNLIVPVEFRTNAGMVLQQNWSCWYWVTDDSNNGVINETQVENCDAVNQFDIDLNEFGYGSYTFFVRVRDDVLNSTDMVEVNSSFSIEDQAGNGGDGGNSGGGGGGSSGSSGGRCFTGWVVGEWSDCLNGQQTRSVTKRYSHCEVRIEEPEGTQSCSLQSESSLDVGAEEVEQGGLVSLLTGAVIGADGKIKTNGIIFFIALIVAIYAFMHVWRAGREKKGVVSTDAKKANTNKSKASDKKTSAPAETDGKKELVALFVLIAVLLTVNVFASVLIL